VIDLEDPGFEARVKHDVEAENFETHRVLDIIGLATFVNMR
jgi:hypothetical protein